MSVMMNVNEQIGDLLCTTKIAKWFLVLLRKDDLQEFCNEFVHFDVRSFNNGYPILGVTPYGARVVFIQAAVTSPKVLPCFDDDFDKLWNQKRQ